MHYETLKLTEDVRKNLPGQFIQLADGIVHYELEGSSDGDIVILVHGFSAPLFVWDHTFEKLVNEGFRVLRYDLYGRGFSDRPKTKYNISLFERQLLQLVTYLDLTEKKFNLVGLSMGGIICIDFTQKHPYLIKKISLIDPAGFPTEKKLFPGILRIPGLGKIIITMMGHKRFIEGQKDDFNDYRDIEPYLKKYTEQIRYEGFLRAIASTIRWTNLTNFADQYNIVGELKIPMQLFWGEKDKTIPFSTSNKIREAIPHIEFHAIKNGGHIPHYTHPEKVNPLLIKFLSSQVDNKSNTNEMQHS